jgi:hypothetical protein
MNNMFDSAIKSLAVDEVQKNIQARNANAITNVASALDTQVGGSHYKDCKVQPVQYIEANDLKFLEGCVVKRVTRHDKPTGKGRQDIEKAIHELQLLLEIRYSEVKV